MQRFSRIMVICDNPGHRAQLVRALEKLGYTAKGVDNFWDNHLWPHDLVLAVDATNVDAGEVRAAMKSSTWDLVVHRGVETLLSEAREGR